MAHSYVHQKGTRTERVRGALGEMGISVTSGAITSSASSLALVLCQFKIFFILGQFIILLIATSFFITMFLMMACLAVAGPHEGQGEVPFLIKWIKQAPQVEIYDDGGTKSRSSADADAGVSRDAGKAVEMTITHPYRYPAV